MDKKYYTNEYYLRDGKILIYKRPNSSHFQCRLLLPNKKGYIIKSCQTRNLGQAAEKAEALYDTYSYKILKKLPLKIKTFADVYNDFLRISNKEPERALFYRGCFDRYFSIFFKDMYIDAITKETFDQYFLWRKNFYTKYPEKKRGNTALHPSYQTLILEKKILQEVMKYAYHTKLIPEIPEVIYTDKRRNQVSSRDDFTKEEYKRIIEKLVEVSKKKANWKIQYQRKMLLWLVVFLANTGIRPAEYKLLQWRDITIKQVATTNQNVLQIMIPTKSKTGKRMVISNPQAYTAYAKIMEFSKYTKGTDLVFTNYDGTPAKHIGQSFIHRLKELNLYISRNNKKRPLYSLRHYYATERLLAGANIYDVALNMGTSVILIEKHYSHTRIMERADNIIQNTNESIIPDRSLMVGAWYCNDTEAVERMLQEKDELPL